MLYKIKRFLQFFSELFFLITYYFLMTLFNLIGGVILIDKKNGVYNLFFMEDKVGVFSVKEIFSYYVLCRRFMSAVNISSKVLLRRLKRRKAGLKRLKEYKKNKKK